MDVGVVAVPARCCGPSDSANGGYVSGLIAEALDWPVEVELRRPPPLETPMRVDAGQETAEVSVDGVVVAVASRLGATTLGLDVPPAVAAVDAEEASTRYLGFDDHPFPRCFTCGPQREVGDGLRIFPGQVRGRPEGTVAAAWSPDTSFADGEGRVPTPVVWAALDCPSGFSFLGSDLPAPLVLGRFAVVMETPVRAGRRHVVVGWRRGREGRKHHAASVLFDEHGAPVAVARALWIQLRS